MENIILIFLPLLLFGCVRKHGALNNTQQHIDNLPTRLFLKNRVENCDSAIVFMKGVIRPIALTRNELPELHASINILGESSFLLGENLSSHKSDLFFYISLECLEGQKSQVIYDIFIKPQYHVHLKSLEREAGSDGFYLSIDGIGGFGFRIANGLIMSARADIYSTFD